MRKIAWFLVCFLVIVRLLSSCSAEASRGSVIRYVEDHREDLEERVETGDFDNIGLPVLEVNAGEECIEFECGGAGFGPETAYWGFFYTAEDNIHTVWCAPPRGSTFFPEGAGQRWKEPGGDNEFYVEHIVGHFYYYEAAF